LKRSMLAAAITAAIVVAVYGIVLPITLDRLEQDEIRAIGGAMDLSGWSFADQGVVRLDGEWEFYAGRLLESGDFAASPQLVREGETIRLPGSWESHMPTFGAATYRLRVHVPNPDGFYGLKTLSIQMASRIYVNGEQVGASGNPSAGADYEAKNKPFAVYFPIREGWNEIIIHAANFDFPGSSGVNHPVYFGPQDAISRLQSKALAHDWISVVSFGIVGLFYVGIYSLRRKDPFLLAFGILCLCIAAYAMTRGERLVFDLFGDVPAWLFLRIQMASTVCAGLAMFAYLRQAFRDYSSAFVCRAMIAVGILFLVAILGFFDVVYRSWFLVIHSVYISVPFLYVTYVFLYAAMHRVRESLLFTLSALALNWHIYIQNLNVYFAVPMFTFPPFEAFLFPLFLSLLMSLNFSDAFKQIERLTGQLIMADRLKDEFLTKTAHEFKAPLHGILHMAKSITSDANGTLSREQSERLGLIQKTAGRLNQLVYDIMDLSRMKQGEMKIRPVPVDVCSSVETILEVYATMAEGKDIRLVNRVQAGFPPVLADENRFFQVIGNLLDNAVKYTDRGFVEISADVRGNMAEIAVRDTGIGMDEREMDVIFEPYQSLHANLHNSFGLGLPIVKQLVELHGGYVRVESKIGQGSRFTVGLPLARLKDNRDVAPKPVRGQTDVSLLDEMRVQSLPEYSFPTPYVTDGQGAFTVLVVDDQYSSLKVLIDMLEAQEYQVIGVKNGEEALEQLASVPGIDLVILDLLMPGLNGFELFRKIRREYSQLELPILMVTASIHPDDKLTAFRAGANDFLTKPVDTAELRARVISLLTMKDLAENAIDLEVAFLQSQMNPHFLFNVLNNIIALSYTNPEKSRELTANLADYLRGSLAFENTEKDVLFSRELAFIRSYAEIEKARYKDRVSVHFEIDEAALSVPVPPLLVQPLAENAIRHGIANRIEGGTVTIRANLAGGRLMIEVEDDGIGMTDVRLSEVLGTRPMAQRDSRSGVGLLNIRKRLKFMYGTDLTIESEPGIGTKVSMSLPLAPAGRAKRRGGGAGGHEGRGESGEHVG